jgi:hypothetical protein
MRTSGAPGVPSVRPRSFSGDASSGVLTGDAYLPQRGLLLVTDPPDNLGSVGAQHSKASTRHTGLRTFSNPDSSSRQILG